MPHVKELTDEEIKEIGLQSGVDPDIIKSWHKGMSWQVLSLFNKGRFIIMKKLLRVFTSMP